MSANLKFQNWRRFKMEDLLRLRYLSLRVKFSMFTLGYSPVWTFRNGGLLTFRSFTSISINGDIN